MSWKDEAISVSETNLPEQDKQSWKDSAVDLDENGQVIPKHSAFVRGFMNSVGVQTPMMIGSSIEGIGRTLPISQNLVDAAAKPFYDMAKSNEYLEPVQIGSYEDIVPENAGISDAPEIISRGLTYAGESIGQGSGSIVPTAVGTGAGAVIGAGIGAARGGISGAISGAAKGADIGGVGGSFSLNYGEIYESLKQEAEQYEKETGIKSSEKDLAEMALIPGLGASALDFVSFKRLMPNMKDITSLSKLTPKEAAKEMFSKYKEGFATEGITEGAQTALGTANNITAFDREVTPEDLTDIVNSSIVGALSGGVIESGANALPIAAKTLRRDVPQDMQPTKDDLLSEMERGTQQEQVVEPQQPEIQAPEVVQEHQPQTELNQQQTLAPTQDNAPEQQSANIGDVIEHITDEGEVVSGTVSNKKVSENGNTTLIVTDDLGNKHVVFEGTGQTNILNKKQPNKDDLLSMMEADNNKQKEQEPVDTLENLNKRLENVRKIAKLNGWNKLNKQKENEILSKIEGLKKQEIDTAALDVAEEPTQAQQEAGNYKKGHAKVSGLDITIENQKDSVRSGIDSDGEKWNVVMPTHYGYIKRTEGADGDHVDAYIGDNPSSETVYIIDQIDANTGAFDEHKTFIGFNNPDEVKNTYYKAFSDGMALKRYGGMTEMSLEQFKDWLKNGDTKKPQETANIDKGVTTETENTDTLSTLTKQENVPQIITGEVGMRLAEKAVVLTSTGRQTTPFPSVGIGSPRRVNLTVERIKKWLMQNALDEARSRGDEFNARQFEANLNRASQADLDSAENYLFNPDFIFENPPKILKDMGENMGISKTETTIEEPTISKEETVKSDPTEIDTSNWIVERLPQGEGQKRKGIIKAGVWDVSIGKLQIRKTREYPENISDADIISKVAELELRDKLNKPKYEPPTAEELEEEKRLEEIAQAEYEKEESERIEQEKAEKRQREEEDEKLQSIGDKITTFLDSKGDAVRYRDHGSKLSRSAYFEIDINPIYEDGEIVDYNDSVKVRISDHTLPPTYGRDNGYADFEFGIRNQADPEFYGEDPQPLFDYINKKIEQSKQDKETQESLNPEETAVSDDVTDKNVGESEEPVKKDERDNSQQPQTQPDNVDEQDQATKKQDRGRKMQDVGEKLEGKRALQDMSPRFSIVGDDEYSLFAGAVKEKSRNKVIKAISRQAKKLGIDLNEIEIFGDISEVFHIPTVESSSIGGEIQGFYYNNLIYISMKAGDYISTLNHEVIHKLRAAGAFTKQEWGFLEGHAKDWREKYNIEENYKELDGMTETKMDEEAIAHAFQDYSNKGFMDRLRGRVRVFFKMLHSVLTGDEFRFETVEDVFEAVLGGYVSKRKFSTDTSAMTMFQTSLETVSKLEDRLIKKYGIKLSLTGKSPVTISMIKVEESQRRNGVAKTVIQEITDWADKTGTTLTLTPTDEYGIRKSVLERFYERNGFVSNSGRNKDFSISESMIRLPIKSTHDVKNDAAMFSLFGNVVGKKLTKKDQLDYAMSSLDDVRGLDRDMRPNIKVISTYLLHPRQIASLFEKFAPVFMAVTNMMQRRDKIVHELTESITQYNHLPRLSKDKVNAVLELGRLSKMSKKTIIKNDDGSITAINSGINAALSKDGDRITLTKEEMDAYVGVRNTMNLALDLYIEVILEEYGYIEKGIKTSKQLEEALDSEADLKEIGRMQDALFMIKEIEKSKRAGYVPFTRWGQIGVTVHSKTETVENENGEQVPKLLHFERIELGVFKGKKVGQNSEVIEAVNRLKEKYGDDADISSFEMKDMTSVKGRIRMRDLDLLAASSDMSRDDYETLREMLQDEVKRRGFRAHFFKAEDVPGYNPDLERALNDYVVSISGHLARRLHQSKVEDTLKPLAESGQERLYKYASNYIDYVTDPIEEYGALRQMGFMWYLAGNVASGLTNATQPIMVTAPWFKAMFSHGNILKNMSKAYKDASMMLTVKSGTDMFDFSKAPDDIKGILKEADEDGLFLPKQTFDAMSIAYTNSQHLRGLNRKARTMMDVMSLTFSIPERMNRLVTYISAYRMAIDPDNKKKIMSFIANDQLGRASLVGKEGKEFAMAFAEYAVYSTQLQMGRLNRPTISRGLGTLPLQFMSFPMQMMELMYRLTFVHGGQKGQAIAFMIMAVVFMSGLKGIPFEDDLQDLIEGAYKRLTRTDIDIDTEVRGLLSKAVGPNMAEAIMKGVPAAFLNVDMSSRLGFGNLVPTEGNDMLGVWWDMLYTRTTTAMTSLARGDTAQAISDLSPAIIKNPLQAYIWSQDGVRSSSTGDTVIIPDDLTKTDIGLKALGFTSGAVSRERERIYARRRADNAVNDLRSDYYDKLARAYAGRIIASRKGDSERQQLFESQIQAINEQKTAYNADKPLHRQIIIHEPSLKKRILEELQGAKANKPRKQSRAEAQKIDEIYGN